MSSFVLKIKLARVFPAICQVYVWLGDAWMKHYYDFLIFQKIVKDLSFTHSAGRWQFRWLVVPIIRFSICMTIQIAL